MSSFKKVGGRYGMHSGSGKFKNLEVTGNSWVDGPLSVYGGISGAITNRTVLFVDADSGSDGNSGSSWSEAKATIQAAVTASESGSIIYIAPKAMAAGATDPSSYAETIIIPATKAGISLIGVGTGRVQGGLPQIKKGSGTTALLTVRAPGCLIANLGFNGIWVADSTQSLVGILLDDDGSTKTAIGTSIIGCHFKNCAGSTGSTDASVGGAITWASTGGAWQVLISDNRFYKNVCDICLSGTSQTVPQDVVIENNLFSGPTATVNCNLYLMGGSGMNGVIIRNNSFPALPSAGSNGRYIKATGCIGNLNGNRFGTTTHLTFTAAGTGAFIPATMFMAENYEEAGLCART